MPLGEYLTDVTQPYKSVTKQKDIHYDNDKREIY